MKLDNILPPENHFNFDPATEQQIKDFYWRMNQAALAYQETILYIALNRANQELHMDQNQTTQKKHLVLCNFLRRLFRWFIRRFFPRLDWFIYEHKYSSKDLDESQIIDVYPLEQDEERRNYYE